MVGYGNEPYSFTEKVLLNIIAGVDKIATQAGQVFYDHTVDMTGFYFLKHLLEGGTIVIQSGQAVVDICFYYLKFRLVRQVILDNQLLVFQGIPAIAVVLNRQADINGSTNEDGPLHWRFHNDIFSAFPCHFTRPPFWLAVPQIPRLFGTRRRS